MWADHTSFSFSLPHLDNINLAIHNHTIYIYDMLKDEMLNIYNFYSNDDNEWIGRSRQQAG